MESLAYTHLALAHEKPSSMELSNVKVFSLLTKFCLLSLLKQQKLIYKGWLYGLSLSLTFIPFGETLALHQAERREPVNNLASNLNPKTILESAKSSSLDGNEKTQLSIPFSKKNESQKVLFVKGDEKKANLANLVHTSPSIQTASTIQPIQKTLNQVSVSNPNYQAEPTQVFSTILAMLETPSSSNTEPEAKIEPEQKGKLRFVNDTPYIGIVALYKPGSKSPYRFAHIPACHKRELLATYSNYWQVNFNDGALSSVSKVSVKNDGFFEIKTSKLTQIKNLINGCEQTYSESKIQLVRGLEPMYQPTQYLTQYKYIKSVLQGSDVPTVPTLTHTSGWLESLTKDIVSNSSLFYYFIDYTKNSGDKRYYCVLRDLLKNLDNYYKSGQYSSQLNLNGDATSSEVTLLLRLNNNKLTSNNELKNLQVLLAYLENYLLIRSLFYNILGEPKYQITINASQFNTELVGTSNRNNGNKVDPIEKECIVQVKTGNISASAPNKKAKYC